MKEEGVLEDFLKHHQFDPAKKYHFNEYNVAFEPMAYMDVSLHSSFLSFLCIFDASSTSIFPTTASSSQAIFDWMFSLPFVKS